MGAGGGAGTTTTTTTFATTTSMTFTATAGSTYVIRMASWDYTSAAVHELRFEDLTHDPATGFRAVLSHLRLDMPDAVLAATLAKYSFGALSGRSPGHEDPSAHYRRGVPGDWRRHFAARHRAEFTRLHGDLAARLGYPAR